MIVSTGEVNNDDIFYWSHMTIFRLLKEERNMFRNSLKVI